MKKKNNTTQAQALGTTIQNCTFTNVPPNAEMVAAVLAVARASEAHALSLQKAVDILKGQSGPLLQINS